MSSLAFAVNQMQDNDDKSENAVIAFFFILFMAHIWLAASHKE